MAIDFNSTVFEHCNPTKPELQIGMGKLKVHAWQLYDLGDILIYDQQDSIMVNSG